ncbi:hypothetical protein QV65_09275, partial [Rhodococcus erythropolis]
MTTTTTTLLAGSDTLSAGVGEAFQNAASSGPLLLALGAVCSPVWCRSLHRASCRSSPATCPT